jgi:hypothetical protein
MWTVIRRPQEAYWSQMLTEGDAYKPETRRGRNRGVDA